MAEHRESLRRWSTKRPPIRDRVLDAAMKEQVMSVHTRHVTRLSAFVLACALTVSAPLVTAPAQAADPFDPEVVLPARVDASLHRTVDAVDRATAAIDNRRWSGARRAVRAARLGFTSSHLAVLRQVQAVPPVGGEEESTAGPDSALAGLNVDQYSITRLAGLFDRLHRVPLIRRIAGALATAQTGRAQLIGVLVVLDPEGAGAPYADALADTVPSYTDEVAAITEALADDHLAPASRRALLKVLERSAQAEAQMTAAFGGGE
jgi:hypothetical protein